MHETKQADDRHGGRVEPVLWEHSSLAVDDLERSIGFYREAFGYDVTFAERGMKRLIEQIAGIRGLECDLAQLRSPASEHVLELIAFRHPTAEIVSLGRPPAAHVAFRVTDIFRALGAVEVLGAEPLGEVTAFPDGRSVYCREPGGSVFELSEAQA
jgi:catechol 2,3-dioxygenase-like lactoylglutathione lyase family enzyme